MWIQKIFRYSENRKVIYEIIETETLSQKQFNKLYTVRMEERKRRQKTIGDKLFVEKTSEYKVFDVK